MTDPFAPPPSEPEPSPYAAPGAQPGYFPAYGNFGVPGYGVPGYGVPGYGVPGYGPPYGQPMRGGTNGRAIASLVTGILGVFFVTPVLAIIFGIIGMNQARQRGQSGRGLAIAGIVLGALWIIIWATRIHGFHSYSCTTYNGDTTCST